MTDPSHPYRSPPDLPRGHFRVLELYEPAMARLFRLCTADYRYEHHRTAGGWRVEATTLIAFGQLEERPGRLPEPCDGPGPHYPPRWGIHPGFDPARPGVDATVAVCWQQAANDDEPWPAC